MRGEILASAKQLNSSNEPQWRQLTALTHEQPPQKLLFWLQDTASLTQRLRDLSRGVFRVAVVAQGWQRPLRSERWALGISDHRLALVRQVVLLCHDRPTVFARTIIPATTLSGKERLLARLGTKPLGERLFADKSMVRGAVEVAVVSAHHRLFCAAGLPQARPAKRIWGRRSLFYLANKPLLVSEFFLPGLEYALKRATP